MFIVLEGPDGSGSSTHAKLLTQALIKKGVDAIHTWQPSTGPVGVEIRDILEKRKAFPGAKAFQKMYSEDRHWHVENVVKPALQESRTIICERYYWSTVIYGNYGGITEETVLQWNQDLPEPDHHIVLLPPLKTCLKRLVSRKPDIFENNTMQTEVYKLYEQYAKREHWPIIDTSGSIKEGQKKLLELLQL